MRKLVIATVLMGALTAGAQGFVTHRAKLARQQSEISAKRAMTHGQRVAAEQQRGFFFVNCEKGADAQQVARQLKANGAEVRMVSGNLILLDAPYSKLDALAGTKGVGKIDVSPKVNKRTDVSRKVTQAIDAINGTGEKLPQAYTGKDVIIGIIDYGFDATHPMFKDKDGNLRIKGVYCPGYTRFGGDSVRIGDWTLTGSVYTQPEEILDTTKVKDTVDSHGSHCISIAAGSTSDVIGPSGQPIGGMAPEADILICNADYDDGFYNWSQTNSVDPFAYLIGESLEYLASEANKQQKPLVVSMSLNAHDGWHDGTSNMAYLIGNEVKYGQLPIILCSSNEGDYMSYLNMRSAAKDTIGIFTTAYDESYIWGGIKTDKNVKMEISVASKQDGYVYYKMPILYDSDIEIEIDPEKGNWGSGVYFNVRENPEDEFEGLELEGVKGLMDYIEEGAVQFFCYQNQAYDQDRNPYIYTEIYESFTNGFKWKPIKNNRGKWEVDDELCFKIRLISDEDIELHCWADMGAEVAGEDNDRNYVYGNSSVSVGDWNTSGEPVSIGAWVANNEWKAKNGTESHKITDYTVGDIATFSSYGTDLAGHKHPNACTPGFLVLAAVNSFDPTLDNPYFNIYEYKAYNNQFTGQTSEREYPYAFMSGTSMATPTAAGIVALWAQAAAENGRYLTCDDIKDIIKHSCDTDKFTENNSERFGDGKINAYKGLLYVLGVTTKIPTLSKDQPKDVNFRVAGNIVYADGAEDGIEVTIYNLQGIPVRQTKVQGGAISIEGLNKGVYAIQLGELGSTLIRK
jgi:subtilisin family serine protease